MRRLLAVVGVCWVALFSASCTTPGGRLPADSEAGTTQGTPSHAAQGATRVSGSVVVESAPVRVDTGAGASVQSTAVVAAPGAGPCGVAAVSAAPTPAALGAIPPDQLDRYRAAAVRFGVPWQVIAGVGSAETDHGASADQVSSTGALGSMQFMPATWSNDGSPSIPVGALGESTTGYATDGDGDGVADVWNRADAVAASARMLARNGAASGTGDGIRAAVFAYNHDWGYVDLVLSRARAYGSPAPSWAAGTCGLLVLDA